MSKFGELMVSRGPLVSEVEQEYATPTNYGSMNNSRPVLSNVRRSTSVRRGANEYDVERVSPRLSNYQKTRKSTNIASSDIRLWNFDVLMTLEQCQQTSSERKRMSKRLTEEAMSYFDECVSISTLDSFDFSAAEDASVNSYRDAMLIAALPLVCCDHAAMQHHMHILEASWCKSYALYFKHLAIIFSVELVEHGQSMHNAKDYVLTANVSPLVSVDSGDKNTDSGRKSQFSLAREPTLPLVFNKRSRVT
ncbi:hypothetical protein AgCh_000178 [Apium graveolens]